VAVVGTSCDHIASSILWEFFSCRLVVCLFVRERTHMFLRIQSMYVGVQDSLFVAANVDDFNCLRMALGPLPR